MGGKAKVGGFAVGGKRQLIKLPSEQSHKWNFYASWKGSLYGKCKGVEGKSKHEGQFRIFVGVYGCVTVQTEVKGMGACTRGGKWSGGG